MLYPRPTSSQKDEVSGDARRGDAPSPLTLDVPSPEQAWKGVELVRALGATPAETPAGAAITASSDAMCDRDDQAGGERGVVLGAATTSSIFSFPFKATAGGPLPSFATLLPTRRTPLSEDPTGTNCGARGSPEERCHNATVPVEPAPLHLVSGSSFPRVSASRAAARGCGEDHEGAAASAAAHPQARLGQLAVPPAASVTRNRSECGFAGSALLAQKPESVAHPSFTDLFVGLERPRWHCHRQQERRQRHCHQRPSHSVDVDADAQAPSISLPSSTSLSLHNAGSAERHGSTCSDEDDVHDDSDANTTEDEDGANTPTVYRSPQLPHWWRSILTPVPGARVSLRPDACRLEFWWIDRLGCEAHEIIRIILKHSIEGVVLRRSGEAAVVVEFRILRQHLKSSSYAVARRSCRQRDASPIPATKTNTSESFSMAFMDSVAPSTLAGSHPVDVSEPTVVQRSPSSTSSTGSVPLDKSTAGTPSPDVYLQLPALVRTDSSCKEEHSRRHSAEPANSATKAIAAAVATAVATIPRAAGDQLASPRFPVPPRTPAAKVSVGAPYARASLSHLRQTQKLEATGGASCTLSPSPRRPAPPPVFNTTATQEKQPLRRSDVQPSPRNGAVPAAVSMAVPSGRISGNGEGRVDATAVDSNGGRDKSVPSWAPASVTTSANGGAAHVLQVAVPLMRRLFQGNRPATKPHEARGTSMIGDADDDVASAVPTPSIGTRRSPCSMSRRRSSPLQQSPCDKLPPTSKVGAMPVNGTGPRSSLSHINSNHSVGEVCLPSILAAGPFLVHVETHHNAKAGVHRRRSGGAVARSPSASASNPLVSASDHCDPALSGSSNTDWQPGGRRSQQPRPWSSEGQVLPQQPYHQHPQGSPTSAANSYPDTTAMVVAAAAEAVRLGDATTPSTRAAASSQQQAAPLGTPQHVKVEDDDSVVAILTLPISMCTPIVVVRLHAMRVLHPLLRAISGVLGLDFSASTSGEFHSSDNTDTDSTDEALVAAAQLPNATPPSSSATHGKRPDYPGAIRIFSEAIASLREEKSAEEAPLTRARDLSILYTVRSHLLFHASPTSLYDSLRDAEAALRCCPAREHINPTYEVLLANLISFGYTSQVEGLARHLRHRWRAASPLLLRLSRVTQVMVSYATIFLRQLLPTSTLRLCVGGSASMMHRRSTGGTTMGSGSLTAMSHSPHSSKGGGVRHSPPSGPSTSSGVVNAASMAQPIAVVCDRDVHESVDRPRPVSPHSTSRLKERISSRLRHSGNRRSPRAVSAAYTATDTALLPTHTLPYEVCPLLLSRYGRKLHAPDERPPKPTPPLSTHAAGTESTNAGPVQPKPSPTKPSPRSLLHGSHQPGLPFRPSTDVCHRRLFLLEALFPSMNPTPVNRLPLPLPRGYRGAEGQRSLQPARQPSSAKVATGGGSDSAAPSNVVLVPKTAPKLRLRAEDFMFDRNSMLALLAATADTTMRWGTAPMQYFCRHIRLSATRHIRKGETILMERPALLIPFWPLLPPLSATASTAAAALRSSHDTGAGVKDKYLDTASAPSYCAQCGRQRLSNPVSCPGGCHSVYCSEECRQLALRLYHVMECGGVPPGSDKVRALDSGDDVGARVRRTVAVLQEVYSDWNSYLHQLALRDTPSMRPTSPHAVCSPVAPLGVWPVSPSAVGDAPGHDAPQQQQSGGANSKAPGQVKRSVEPPPILAVTALRVVARLGAMLLSLALPVELLPQMQGHPAWTAERHAMIRAVARTLHQRGLMVPATTTSSAAGGNAYCTHVDPHRLLLLEVLLQQLSVPFFADFNYRASSTVWEGLRQIPLEVTRGSENPSAPADAKKAVGGSSVGSWRSGMLPSPTAPVNVQQQPQRSAFVEFTPAQLEEVLCDLHGMVHRVYEVLAKELVDVPSLPLCGAEAEEEDSLECGLPGRWSCVELLGFLNSTRAFQQISDFSLTSWAVVYPRDMEPPNVAAATASDSRSSPQARSVCVGDDRPMSISHCCSNSSTITNEFSHAGPSSASSTAAVPLAIISPWSCLTVDLHPILGNALGGVIYSRFMVEHEQRRRMLAYCAAAAGRRGGDGTGGGSGNEDSFLSVHSAASTSAGPLRDDLSLQLLEEAARRSCSNLHLSLVYTPAKEPAVVVVAKKNITPGDVLWWESLNCREYVSEVL
ncbi:hypothetical protein LSCM1_07424 [Leishmania martiniquensis]|uniref:MYND-type domain-containing protein n=1 Tax=Leishmania martiniquensis TaxID=1580590 RepID=A0A836H7X2_9TRYP|nr:hypothetical protein LSCM1_07424 [Leishmania martiniquensis]